MTGVSTTLRLVDQMTAPIMAIQHAISGMENRFNAINNAADIDTSSLTAMQNQIDMSDAAARVLADNMQLIEDNIQNMSQGQSGFNEQVRQGGSAADSLVKKIGAAVAAYASIQGIKNVL